MPTHPPTSARALLLGLAVLMLAGRPAAAQGPNVGAENAGSSSLGAGLPSSSESSLLGPAPGEGGGSAGVPGQGAQVIGGRPGSGTPRVPTSATVPNAGPPGQGTGSITPPPILPLAELPLYGALEIPTGGAEEGPPDGLTLDAAIDRVMRANLDLLARSYEIPQAQADILTASLRANPLLYADSQLIPYGNYSKARPGGPNQFDVNVTIPLDVNNKRRARMAVACQAKRVLEAQLQNAVRLQIDNLYRAYVDVLAARETLRYAGTSLAGFNKILKTTGDLMQFGVKGQVDVTRVRILRDASEIAVAESESAVAEAKRALGVLLNLPPSQAQSLELRGTLRGLGPPPPPVGELTGLAIKARPDLMAFRLGVGRAQADVQLAKKNRFSDVYLLYQPYTFQNNSPFETKSAHSWALGATVPLPVFNRNQGNIARAETNVVQTRTELAALEQQVVGEVERAARIYAVTRASVERLERELLPAGRRLLDDSTVVFRSGESDVLAYLNAQREYNEVVRQYRDTTVRHRRSTLELNTVVGMRVLP